MAPAGKIFGIGLSRTGTTSLNTALIQLGYSAIHFPTHFDAVERHDAATDTPVALNYRSLDQRYPTSRFILTVRSEEEWLESCEKFWRKNDHDFTTNPLFAELHTRLYGGVAFDRQRFAGTYARHCERAVAHFAKRPDDFLRLDIFGEKNPWQSLCAFLEKPVPDCDFPHQNRSRSSDVILGCFLDHPDLDQIAAITKVSRTYLDSLPPTLDPIDLDDGLDAYLMIERLIAVLNVETVANYLQLSPKQVLDYIEKQMAR